MEESIIILGKVNSLLIKSLISFPLSDQEDK